MTDTYEDYRAPRGYSNATEIARRQAEVADEAATVRLMHKTEATGEAAETTNDLLGGIIEEGKGKFPVSEPDTRTGMDVAAPAGDLIAGMGNVMDTALRASQTARATRSVLLEPTHEGQIRAAVTQILDPPQPPEDEEPDFEYEVEQELQAEDEHDREVAEAVAEINRSRNANEDEEGDGTWSIWDPWPEDE